MVIIETSIFTKQVQKLLSEDEYRELQYALVERPAMGQLIVGSGGLRKIRWRSQGRGKRGGVRIIYYWAVSSHQLLMLLIYPKSRQADLTAEQIRILKSIIEETYP